MAALDERLSQHVNMRLDPADFRKEVIADHAVACIVMNRALASRLSQETHAIRNGDFEVIC